MRSGVKRKSLLIAGESFCVSVFKCQKLRLVHGSCGTDAYIVLSCDQRRKEQKETHAATMHT